MATFHGFTESSFDTLDSNSTVNASDFVVGYTGGADPGSERKISLDSLKQFINKDQIVVGAGLSNTTEGGQITLCSSSTGTGRSDASWRIDTITRGAEDHLRFFNDNGNASIIFNETGKIVIGGSDDVSNGSSLLVLPRASANEILPSAWVVTGFENDDALLTYGGSDAEWDAGKQNLLGTVVSAGGGAYDDDRERKGWHAITGVEEMAFKGVRIPVANDAIGRKGLYVQQNDQVRLYTEDTALEILGKDNNGVDFTRFKIDSSGITSTGKLQVNGDIRTSGNVTTQSDGRYKDDVATISNGIDSVKQLRGVSYFKKNSKTRDIGIIAQEIETVLPELVVTHSGGVYADEKSVNYNGIIPVLIEAVKEQQQQIEELQKRVS